MIVLHITITRSVCLKSSLFIIASEKLTQARNYINGLFIIIYIIVRHRKSQIFHVQIFMLKFFRVN